MSLQPTQPNQFLVIKKIGSTLTGIWRKITAADLGVNSTGTGNKYLADDLTWKTISTGEYYETVSKNLKSYPATFNYSGNTLTSITYIVPGGNITKTFNYTGDLLTSIVLSGNTPTGISLTKTLNYTSGQLLSITYS